MTAVLLAALLTIAPTGWALPGYRVHLTASEDLDADRLRALARPEVVLWLTTRSNALRASTAETVRQAAAAFVQQRPPLRSQDLAPFRGHVGPWLAEAGLDVSRTRRWSPGRLAVEVVGPLDPAVLERVAALRPAAVRWRPAVWPDAAEWGRAARLTGLEMSVPEGPVPGCDGVPRKRRVRLRLPLARVDAAPCGLPVRVELPPDVDAARVVELLVARPDAELALDVGQDTERADRARWLLETLSATTPGTVAHAPGRADAGTR
jgi:hypothetical protein